MRIRLSMQILLIGLANVVFAENNLDSLLTVLDNAIIHHGIYSREKESRIDRLRNRIAENKSLAGIYEANLMLFREFKAYRCDSSILYLNRNIDVAGQLEDQERINESKLMLSHLLASSGMYLEATGIIKTIDKNKLSGKLLIDYYVCYDHIYGEVAFYTQDKRSSERFRRISMAYKDSIYSVIDPASDIYIRMREIHFRDAGDAGEALRMNDVLLNKTKTGTPGYAMNAFHRALDYRSKGDRQMEKYSLTLSALSDIQSAIKDHASLWMLAQLLYEDGDIERAYRYIRFSWSETVFYNTRLRSLQSANILSLIDKTYHALTEKQNRQLQLYIILISALVIALVIAFFHIYRQMKKLAAARNNLQGANIRLKELNQELKEMNVCLRNTNLDLSESNHIKEEYIGRFIKLCSKYIDKLDAYRRMVHRKITHGQIEEIVRVTRSPAALDDEINELYINFDRAFLHIFPDFVNKFNELLIEGEQIMPKKGELLNTELRIFALIRLGINDSMQIAEFLRYSLNTIYNYRAKVKNKARMSRDDFENSVMMIR